MTTTDVNSSQDINWYYVDAKSERVKNIALGMAEEETFIGFSTHTQSEAYDEINRFLYEAAQIDENGSTEPSLSNAEAHLALASLYLLNEGNSGFDYSTVREARDQLEKAKSILAKSTDPKELEQHCMERAKGWRRLNANFVANQVKATFFSGRALDELKNNLKSRSTLEPGILAFIAIQNEVGDLEDTIKYEDILKSDTILTSTLNLLNDTLYGNQAYASL